ncbi:MAG: DNA internalization-related competence protein ComEC/Rec2 [Motiliproteus sp.]|nr:DNA internalization-related competence protein ComEC/Rec2 [Motiliproteus sp.]MCW9051799.1 DNA internalization-related competence protein ComEC/Rec2 [Motiliproteus sp.]
MIRFSLAVAVIGFFPGIPPLWLGLGLPLLGLVLSTCLRTLGWFRPVLFGLLWGLIYGYWGMAHQLPESWQGKDVEVLGQVTGLPTHQHNQCRFVLTVDEISVIDESTITSNDNLLFPRKLRLSNYHCPESVNPGDLLHLVVRLKRPRGYRNPGGFDSERRNFSLGIDGVGYVRQSLIAKNGRVEFWNLHRMRWQLSNLIAENAKTSDANQIAVLQGLLVGDKRGISTRQWQLFRDTGVIHLLVISGLHIGLVCAAGYALLFYAGRLVPMISLTTRIRVAVFGALFLSLIYSLMAGFSLPTQRALVMVSVLLVGWLIHRRLGAWVRLKFAMAAVVAFDPLALFSPGFWLSFGAAGILLYVIGGRVAGVQAGIIHLSRLQLTISLLMLPLLAFQFYQVPLVSPLVNLIAVPVVSFLLLPLAFVSLIAAAISDQLSALGFHGCGVLIQLGFQFLAWMDSNLNWIWHPPVISYGALVMALLGVLVLFLPAAFPGRWLGTLLWLPMLTGSTQPFRDGEFRLTTLDVGQGLSVVVETANHRMLYDTGRSFRSGFNLAEAVVEPYLRQRGIHQLDLLMISHGDNDHAGGAVNIVKAFEPERVISSARFEGIATTPCYAGQRWHWDGVDFELLHPQPLAFPKSLLKSTALSKPNHSSSRNNRSCVLKISGLQSSVLLTGDIETVVEEQLLKKYGEFLNVDILLAPHHGSKSSSSDSFLDQVSPEMVIVSSGYRNRFGHPHPSVIKRIRQREIPVYDTAKSGAISVQSSVKQPLLLIEYTEKKQHYWWN